jgi:hypothetical protein
MIATKHTGATRSDADHDLDSGSLPPERRAPNWLITAIAIVLVGAYALYCHGCHGDVDDELIVWILGIPSLKSIYRHVEDDL